MERLKRPPSVTLHEAAEDRPRLPPPHGRHSMSNHASKDCGGSFPLPPHPAAPTPLTYKSTLYVVPGTWTARPLPPASVDCGGSIPFWKLEGSRGWNIFNSPAALAPHLGGTKSIKYPVPQVDVRVAAAAAAALTSRDGMQ